MKNFKSKIIAGIAVILIVLFSVFSKTVIVSVKYSLSLCYTSVIPALFPFFILCEFLMSAVGSVSKNAAVTAYFSSLITGFPTGIKNVCKLYESGCIDRKSTHALLHCTANASPAYVITFIGTCIIKSKSAGIILLVSQIIVSFACALFFGAFRRQDACKTRAGVINITDTACISISNSVISCLYVCGYIVFFGIIADILTVTYIPDIAAKLLPFLPAAQVKAVLLGMIEITRGIMALDFTDSSAITTAAVILGFSGISVIMQCLSCTVSCKLSKIPVIAGKLIYTALMPVVAYCLSKFVPYRIIGVKSNSNPIISFVLFLVFILFCIVLIYNIFDKSSGRLYNVVKNNGR